MEFLHGLEVRADDFCAHSDSKNMSWRLFFSSNLNSDIHVKEKKYKLPSPKRGRSPSTPRFLEVQLMLQREICGESSSYILNAPSIFIPSNLLINGWNVFNLTRNTYQCSLPWKVLSVFKWPNILDKLLDIKIGSTEWQIWHIWGFFLFWKLRFFF